MARVFGVDDEVFADFAFYSTAAVFKMMLMSPMTSITRRKKKAWSNPEDITSRGYSLSEVKPITNDPDVERVRRVHQNDLENIVPFVLIGLFYVTTEPSPVVAKWHFRVFLLSRVLHTIVYKHGIPQPARGLCYSAGALATLSMAFHVFRHYKPW